MNISVKDLDDFLFCLLLFIIAIIIILLCDCRLILKVWDQCTVSSRCCVVNSLFIPNSQPTGSGKI